MSFQRVLLASLSLVVLFGCGSETIQPTVFEDPSLEVAWTVSSAGGIAVSADGRIYVSNPKERSVQVFTTDGDPVRDWSPVSDGSLPLMPGAIAVDGDGVVTLLVSDYDVNRFPSITFRRIQRYSEAGTLLNEWESTTRQWAALDVDPAGNVFVLEAPGESPEERILRYSPDGALVAEWGPEQVASGAFELLTDITFGGRDHLFVLDRNARTVYEYTLDGNLVNSILLADGHSTDRFSVDIMGNLHVSRLRQDVICTYSGAGEFITEWGPIDQAILMSHEVNGKLFVVDLAVGSSDRRVSRWRLR